MTTESITQKPKTSSEELDEKIAELNKIMDRIPIALGRMFQHLSTPENETAVLKSFDLCGVADFMTKCSKIIVMAGAGISTSAGIPDFRTPGTGLYSQLEKYNLPTPESIFALEYFRENPKPFFLLSKSLYPQNFEPTMTHYFFRLLNEKGKLLRVFTQNIDSLEKLSGLPDEKIVEAHGTFFTAHCLNCRKEYSLDHIKQKIFNDEIPYCSDCSNIIKPDIVFFGEDLPERFSQRSSADFPQCDLLLIMGTSLQVAPFNTLISRVNQKCPRVLINMEAVGNSLTSWHAFNDTLKFDSEQNYRDVFHKSSCDDGVIEIVKLLHWQKDFEKILGKKIFPESNKTSAQRVIVETRNIRHSSSNIHNSKSTNSQTTINNTPRRTSPQRSVSSNKFASLTASTTNKKNVKKQ